MKSKEKLRNGIIIAAIAVVLVVIIVLYAVFIQSSIFRESAGHLSEVFGQTSSTVQQRITTDGHILKSWEEYIKETVNKE